MATAIPLDHVRAVAPARTKTRRISSVAYATDDRASEEKTARATGFERRSCGAWAVAFGSPTRKRFRDSNKAVTPRTRQENPRRRSRQSPEGTGRVARNGGWSKGQTGDPGFGALHSGTPYGSLSPASWNRMIALSVGLR